MMEKVDFKNIYLGIESEKESTVLYTKTCDYSVILKIENPVEQYSADIAAYYDYNTILSNLLRILGDGYAIQKQDILCRQKYNHEIPSDAGYLSRNYFSHFLGREYTDLTTYLIITQESKKSGFFQYDENRWSDFHSRIQKVIDFLSDKKIPIYRLNEVEIRQYVNRYLAVHFQNTPYALDNFKVNNYGIKIGDKYLKSLSLVDIEEVELPKSIKPWKENVENSVMMPSCLMSFLSKTPGADCVIYNQVIMIPSQRVEKHKLAKKKNHHNNIKNEANKNVVDDIINVENSLDKNSGLLIYCHFNILVASRSSDDLDNACNYISNKLMDSGITISKNSYNQIELFKASFPGNSFSLKYYDRFLCTHDAALCMMYKEKLKKSENTPLKIYYTDRQGLPICMDITGKEGKEKYTDNSNFFSLGPTGSGKSFNQNTMVRQLFDQNTDIVMVDTGNSYEGLCSYVHGRYITYTEEKPITMNPFNIKKIEYNLEKVDFLKNLVFLLWKGTEGEVSKVEDRFIQIVIKEYFANYFSNEELSNIDKMKIRKKEKDRWLSEEEHDEDEMDEIAHSKKIENFIKEQDELISKERKKERTVTSLSFNSFYEFICARLPEISKEKNVSFPIDEFKFILESFYKGGEFETILNDDCDTSLFDEQFIVFEIDAIQDNKILFPITTLIIMDLFIQKMRIKKNRKYLIIEEAWKAIASPLMANYIKYLYKTARKFWGSVGVVTQDLEDIISNEIVKSTIINNSGVIILLDQKKLKDNYDAYAKLLGLNEVECRKIWSINNLNNKEDRPPFKEVYINRGGKGDVYGIEEPMECYMIYTTERVEKEALKTYIQRYGQIDTAVSHFCGDFRASSFSKILDFSTDINKSTKKEI